MQLKILITGGTGFVGRRLVSWLRDNELYQLRLALRDNNQVADIDEQYESIEVGNINGETSWDTALDTVDVVVHLAARAHVLKDFAADPGQAFRETNFYATQRLAKVASERGVKRFIYISSIGVNGAQTEPGTSFTELDEPHPHNSYALSKWAAEQAIRDISVNSGMEFVIIRPPLVYGKAAPGNFTQLLKIISSGVPLPLDTIHNLRSFVALDNLVDFIEVCCTHPKAANQVFLISDGEDVSTSKLVQCIANSMGREVSMFSMPSWLLNMGAILLGQRLAIQRLCGNLQLDISKARTLLGWTPVVSMDEGLRQATEGWQKR